MPARRQRPGARVDPSTPDPQQTAGGQGEDEDAEYLELQRQVVHSTEAEMLYIPPKIEAEPPELPDDWSTIGHKQLQRLHGAFATYALRAGYLEKIEEAKAMICKNAADELFDSLFGSLTVTERSSVTHVKAQVESDPHIRRWRRRQQKHTAFALSHKMDREGYQKITEALSRLHTMKNDEWVQAGGKS